MSKFRYTEWQNVASEVQTLRLTVLDQLNSFIEAQQAFQSAGKLSGTGWDSTKSYFDAYSEVSTTVGNALNTLDDAITSYLSAFTSEVGPAENDLDTAKMENLKAELRRLQAENDVIMEALAKAFEDVPFVNQFFNKQSMLGTAKKIEILEKYSAFEASHGSDFSDVQTVITSIAEGLAFLGSAGNFSGGKDGYKTIDFKNQKWYKALKDFNKEQPKDRIDVVIKELSNGVEYQIYRNGKLDVQRTKELHELFRVHNVELFKEYGPEIFKILTNVDDIEILFGKDSTTMQRSSSGVFLLLAILPIDRVKDILKSAKLLRNGDYTLDAVKLTVKEWEALKEFEKSADVVKTVDRGKDVGKVSGADTIKQSNDFATKPFLPDAYYKGNRLPSIVEPSTNSLDKFDDLGNLKQTKFYDQYGREKGWVDYSNHGRPDSHSAPHWHEYIYDSEFPLGKKIDHKFDTNPPFSK